MKKKLSQSSFRIWEGKSKFDGKPISAIVTGVDGSSKNPKTGRMAQMWILNSVAPPYDAVKAGDDSCVCGDCDLKPSVVKSSIRPCYVGRVAWKAPNSVWKHNIFQTVQIKRISPQLF